VDELDLRAELVSVPGRSCKRSDIVTVTPEPQYERASDETRRSHDEDTHAFLSAVTGTHIACRRAASSSSITEQGAGTMHEEVRSRRIDFRSLV
jgi:uncharacterized protein YpuA (DUF1002 family)